MKKLNVPSFRIIIQVVFIFCLFSLPILNSFAQPRQLQFNYLTPDNGLSSSLVISLLQDHNGFMWIGTYDGLNRYDGQNFVIYKNDISDSKSLACDQIRNIFEDRNNNLFIGTNCGLCLFDPSHDNFINFMSLEGSPFDGLNSFICYIIADSLDNLWLSTDVGLMYFDRKNNTSKIYVNEPNNPESLSNNWVECTFIDSKGRMWVSTRGGLNLFQPESGTFKHITKGINPGDDYSEETFLEIAEDKEGNIWFGSYNGLFCFENSSTENNLIRYINDPYDPNSISSNRLLSVYVDKENNLWVGAENDGLFLYNQKNKNFWHYQTNDYDLASLNNESVQAITLDNTGNLWVGTYGGGLNISPKNSEGILSFKHLKGSELSLSNNVVTSFCEDYKGQIWIGTDGGGLNLFNESTKQFERFNEDNAGFSSNVILSITEDSDHNFWMGSWNGGLIKFNPETKTCVTFTTKNSKIQDDNIFWAEIGNHNDLWLASYRNGLIHYKIDKNEFIAYTTENSSIGNNYVFIIKKDSKGHLILGTTNGIKIFTPETETFTNYPHIPDNPASISHGTVYDIQIENDTSIWVGTQSGLNRFNPETGIFKRYYKKDGLPNNVVRGLVFDKYGILWVTTNRGICRFDYKNKPDIFTKEDGLQSNEFNFKSTMLSKNGKLFFGGVNGFNIIDPDKIVKNLKIPRVIITGLEILNKPITPNEPGSPLTTDISETDEMTLKYDQNILTFYFAVMDFTRPEKNQYAYMLENFNDNWIYSENKREATYTNLDPGEYIFRVKGSNNDGIWNEEGTSLKITILPPWYLTWYFKIIFAIAFLSLIIAIFYIRTSTLQKQKEILTITVDEKTKDLQNKNILLKQNSDELSETNSLLKKRQEIIEIQKDELELQAEELKTTAGNLEVSNLELSQINATKDKLFSIIAHDLRTPFNGILGFSELLIEKLKNYNDAESEKFLRLINLSAKNTLILLDNLLNWAKSQTGQINFNPEKLILSSIIREIIEQSNSIAKFKDISLIQNQSDEIKVYADENMLKTILRNLISNAIKFTNPGGNINISAISEQKQVEISISDNGVGMNDETLKKIFDISTNTTSRGTANEKGSGLGLVLCKEFVEKHSGKIWVESEEGKGSDFKFTLPLNK